MNPGGIALMISEWVHLKLSWREKETFIYQNAKNKQINELTEKTLEDFRLAQLQIRESDWWPQ